MHIADASNETLKSLYRFALLLTGEAGKAEEILTATVSRCVRHLAQCRRSRHGWVYFLKHLRQAANSGKRKTNGDHVSETETPPFPRQFGALPEPGRSALALYYLELLSIDEIAGMFDLDLDQLGVLLGETRCLLRNQVVSLSTRSFAKDICR